MALTCHCLGCIRAGADVIKVATSGGVMSAPSDPRHGHFRDAEIETLVTEASAAGVPTPSALRAVIAAADAGVPLADAVVAKARMVTESHDDSIRRAFAAGVKVAMGTDAGVGAHGANLDELGLMAALGMTPLDAWVATTSSAAALFGLDTDYGTLEPGKITDVVLLHGMYDDLSDLKDRILSVYQGGIRVSQGKQGTLQG